jgi:hypothetical protein
MTIQAYPGGSGGHEWGDQKRTGELEPEEVKTREDAKTPAGSRKVKIVTMSARYRIGCGLGHRRTTKH